MNKKAPCVKWRKMCWLVFYLGNTDMRLDIYKQFQEKKIMMMHILLFSSFILIHSLIKFCNPFFFAFPYWHRCAVIIFLKIISLKVTEISEKSGKFSWLFDIIYVMAYFCCNAVSICCTITIEAGYLICCNQFINGGLLMYQIKEKEKIFICLQ